MRSSVSCTPAIARAVLLKEFVRPKSDKLLGDAFQSPGVPRFSGGLVRPRVAQRSLHKRLEQRVAVTGGGGELRMELTADEPRVAGQLDHLAQPVFAWRPAHIHPGG